MKKSFLYLFLFLTHLAFAQQVDSIQQKINNTLDKVQVDSLLQLPQLPDSLLHPYQKVDSIRRGFNHQADSLKQEYTSAISRIDSVQARLQKKIDSLGRLNLPANRYTHKLDSLNQAREEAQTKFNNRLSDLKSKTTGKLKALDLPPQYQEPLNALTKNVDGFSLQGESMKIPGLEIPGYQMPKLDGLGNLPSNVGDIGQLGDLPKIETPVGDLGQVGQQVKSYQGDIKSIANGNLNDVKELPKTLEQQATKVEGVGELQKQAGVLEDYKGKLEMVKDPAANKEKAVEMAKEAAIDHFAGKEQQLKAAMEKMSKYKQKYSSVSSIKDLPKRPPNAMKGKPFIERIVPGLFFQYQQKNYNLFDFNLYAGYRLGGRFTAGAGWNQRFAYDKRSHGWNPGARIYGPRAYLDFKLGKGFIAHLETEVMNTFVPFNIRASTGEGQREWVWAMMTGVKKEYKIYKNLRGTVLIQYNLFNPEYKAPYVDRLNSRIGFEYALKKKKAKSSTR